jgi:hypothetical protein
MQGHELGLRPGDLLVGIDGRPWQGSLLGLRTYFRTAPQRVLTFLRNDVSFSVIASTAALGTWEHAEAPRTLPDLPPEGRSMVAWQVLAGPDNSIELVPLRPDPLALAVPLFWLAQNRMWAWFATLVGTLALSILASLVLAGIVWVCFGLHLWRYGRVHLVRERIASGSRPLAVLAAADAADAARVWSALAPAPRLTASPPAPTPAADIPAAVA